MIRPQSCPVCNKVLAEAGHETAKTAPFCSVRCREVDLYRWSVGKYAIVEPLAPEHLENLDDYELPGHEFDEGE